MISGRGSVGGSQCVAVPVASRMCKLLSAVRQPWQQRNLTQASVKSWCELRLPGVGVGEAVRYISDWEKSSSVLQIELA